MQFIFRKKNAGTEKNPTFQRGLRILTTEFERDPDKHAQIKDFSPIELDDTQLFYISEGSYQPILIGYPFRGPL